MIRHVSRVVAVGIVSALLVTLALGDAGAQPSTRWPIHSRDRPVRRRRPLTLAKGGWLTGRVEGGERRDGSRSEEWRDCDARLVRGCADAHRVELADAGDG